MLAPADGNAGVIMRGAFEYPKSAMMLYTPVLPDDANRPPAKA